MRQLSADSNSLKNKIISSSQHNKKRKQPSKDNNDLFRTKKSFLKPLAIPLISSSVDLPIAALRAQLVECVKSFPTTIIVGETGSGKSTQLVQYLADEFHGKGQPGCIVCTQPRRVAAVTIAQRVAAERGCTVGSEVGYSIRFEDKTSTRTKIKFVTGR
jgi:ATP-dependent RNA helicase DHX8/PRP22